MSAATSTALFHAGKTTTADLANAFDRVVVVNLARRQERLSRFRQRLDDWPFKQPERFEAVDGLAVGVPAVWDKGAGAWGCMLSHRAIIAAAIRDGVSSLLVLEDDARPVANFSLLAEEFLTKVPGDWDCLMLGAGHLLPPALVCRGVVRCGAANRTHAYAVRGPMMRTLLSRWEQASNDHCDIILASLMQQFKAYAPNPFLIGQDAGYSDVTDTTEPVRFLSRRQIEALCGTGILPV
jgi:hypothetical protein